MTQPPSYHTGPVPCYTDEDVDVLRVYFGDDENTTLPVDDTLGNAVEILALRIAVRELDRLLHADAWNPLDFRRGTAALARQRILQLTVLANGQERPR